MTTAENEQIDPNELSILLARNWVGGEIARARDLNLQMFHVGWELVVQGLTLMTPEFRVYQTRESISAIIMDLKLRVKALEPRLGRTRGAVPIKVLS